MEPGPRSLRLQHENELGGHSPPSEATGKLITIFSPMASSRDLALRLTPGGHFVFQGTTICESRLQVGSSSAEQFNPGPVQD